MNHDAGSSAVRRTRPTNVVVGRSTGKLLTPFSAQHLTQELAGENYANQV
ncbi:MAG: hypothetical protein LC768_10275 [Acidobacteria bacterium]|nr:hypothetical protein [Acidobacteriota bacterium]MCA1638701.1 hypothetical protein [Acidobacteriota bacterium]